MLLNSSDTMDDFEPSSDEEKDEEFLQELFAAGKLKPGLNFASEKKNYANNVNKLNECLSKMKKDLAWVETMDIVNEPAALAPELSMELKEQEEFVKSGRSSSLSLNEFKRETLFHRQAQLAAIEGIARLKSQGYPTIRPNDYFAEMMKSDDHMQKVRRSLLEKQAGLQRSEKVKQMRQHKKLAKQKEVETILRKQKDKRSLNEEIKKYRKGMRPDLDFLDKTLGKNTKHEMKSQRGENTKYETNKSRPGKNKFDMKKNRPGKNKFDAKKTRPGKDRRKKMKR